MHNKETPSSSIYTETSCWTAAKDMCRPSIWSRFNCEWTTPHERLVNHAHAAMVVNHTRRMSPKAWNPKHWPHPRNKSERQNTNLQQHQTLRRFNRTCAARFATKTTTAHWPTFITSSCIRRTKETAPLYFRRLQLLCRSMWFRTV